MKTIISPCLPIASRQYRQAVLNRSIRGEALREVLQQGFDEVVDHLDLQNVYHLNQTLYWHLAHTPDLADRTAVLEYADLFGSALSNMQEALMAGYLAAAREAVPYSPAIFRAPLTSEHYGLRLFPQAAINWDMTYTNYGPEFDPQRKKLVQLLLKACKIDGPAERYLSSEGFGQLGLIIEAMPHVDQQQAGFLHQIVTTLKRAGLETSSLFVVAHGLTPEYRAMQATDEQLADSAAAFDHFRMFMTARNRIIGKINFGFTQNYLNFDPDEHFVIQQPGNLHEQTLTFPFYPDYPGPIILYFFLKHGWPVGYGMAISEETSRQLCTIGIHIFRDFRGTPSSGRFFETMIMSAARTLRPTLLSIERDLSGQHSRNAGLLAEDEPALTRFYGQYGFEWDGEEQTRMIRLTRGLF